MVFGDSFENHLYNLVGVLKRLREAGLKVKPSKCSLCQRETFATPNGKKKSVPLE